MKWMNKPNQDGWWFITEDINEPDDLEVAYVDDNCDCAYSTYAGSMSYLDKKAFRIYKWQRIIHPKGKF